MIRLNVDGSKSIVEKPTLDGMQKIVGGYIEVVETNDGRLLIIDEEGKLKYKPCNLMATALTRGMVADSDVIVGDVLIAEKDEME